MSKTQPRRTEVTEGPDEQTGEAFDQLIEKAFSLYEEKITAGELKILTPEEAQRSTEEGIKETEKLLALVKSKVKPPSP